MSLHPAVLGSAVALLLAGAAVPEAAANTFSTLTYNVAGLPQGISGSNPAVNTVQISPLLNPYDLVLVQEDFFYHADLVSQITHPYQSVKDTSNREPWILGFGDGLNTFSRLPFSDFTRVTWTDCFGGLGSFGSDCLAPKGFSLHRHELAPGVWLDVYNLHADAGSDAGSLAARQSNLRQLRDYILAHSAGNALLVLGDFNSRYTRSGDIMPELVAATGLTDVWVELVRGGSVPAIGPTLTGGCAANPGGSSCERIDKILYRSSTELLLAPLSYAVPTHFVDASGVQLSDHHPVSASFQWSVIPEPGTGLLLGLGLLALARRRTG